LDIQHIEPIRGDGASENSESDNAERHTSAPRAMPRWAAEAKHQAHPALDGPSRSDRHLVGTYTQAGTVAERGPGPGGMIVMAVGRGSEWHAGDE
jgi:hypothetical protein